MENTFWKIIDSFKKNEYFRKLKYKVGNNEYNLIFLQNLADTTLLHQYFTSSITMENIYSLDLSFPGTFYKIQEIREEIIESIIFKGSIILYIDENTIYNIFLPKTPERGIDESLIDPPNMYGGRESLVESLDKNVALIERKIKTRSLSIEKIELGVRTNTEINIIYIKDIASKSNVSLIKEKISSINTDSVITITDITNKFNQKSLVPLIGKTASLDVITESILNGRIIVLIDQLPVAIVMPVNIAFFSSLKEEASSPFYYSFYTRLLTTVLLLFSVFFLGLYVSFINYHPESLSLIVLSEIKMTIRGTTVPLYIEILYILMTFEFLRMASSRTPSNNMQNILVIVGGILIGQNSVNSGFIGAFNLVITSICYLSTFGITNDQHLVTSFSILRMFILIFSLILGFFGFIMSSLAALIYLYNLKSLSSFYLSPLMPIMSNELKRAFIPKNFLKRPLRPKSVDPNDNTI